MRKQLKQVRVWFSRKRVLLFVLILSLTILGAAIYRFAKQNNWLEAEFAMQVQNIELNEEVTELNLYIKNAESAERGYVISGDRSFVENFDSGIDSILAIYSEIQELQNRKEDRTDAALFLKSDSLVRQKVAFMQRVKSLCDNNDCKSAAALISSNEGLRLSDSITNINKQIDDHIRVQIKQSQAGFLKADRRNNNLAYIGIAASILLIVLVFYLLIVEIWRVRKISEELRIQKERYRVTLNSLGEGLISTDKEGKIIYMNPSAEKFTGWKWQEAKNQLLQNVFNVVDEASGKPIENVVSRILKDRKQIEWENNTILKSKNADNYIISNNGSPILDINGNLSGAVLVFNDITEKDKIKKELVANEKQYQNLIQNLPEAIYTCDAEGYIKLYNKAAVELWGREPVAGKELWCGSWKIFNTDGTYLPLNSCPMAITLKEGMPVHGKEILVQRPDESYRHVLPYPSPLFSAEGQLTGAINMLIDVTDKKELKILTQKTEEKYQNLVEQASDAILIYSLDGTIYEFNKACCTMLGYSKEEYAKLELTDILVDEIIVNQDNYAAILAGETKTLYRKLMHKDGSLIETEVTVKILADGKGIAFARDITERKRAEKELLNSNIRLEHAEKHANIGSWQRDLVSNKRYWSKNMFYLFGLEPADNPPALEDYLDCIHPDDRQNVANRLVKISGGHELSNYEYRTNPERGPVRNLYVTLYYEKDAEGVIIKYNGCILDITERKKAETKTKAALERYNLIADATSDTIWDWDIVNNMMLYNEGVTKMFGYESSKVENVVDWWNEKLHSEDFKKVQDSLDDVFENGLQRFQLTYRFRCADCSYKHIFDRAFVTFDENGKPCRITGSMQDITYQVEEEIRVAKAIIDAQEQERSYLGAELHDNINQILASTMLTLSMAKSKEINTSSKTEFIESAMGNINDAIRETRKLSHHLAPASFDDRSIKDVFEELLLSINLDNRFIINFHFDEINETLIPENIQINLYRILQEQTKNIMKYANASALEISVKIVASTTISLRIFDNGKGFNTKTIKNGIGLSNIKKRAETLNGEFILNSEPGKGCEVIVEIPLGI